MKIKKIALTLSLVISSFANAEVELKSSDDNQLLVNGSAVMLKPRLVGADGEEVKNLQIVSIGNGSTASDAWGIANIDGGYSLAVSIGRNGVSFPMSSATSWIYRDYNCTEVIGIPKSNEIPMFDINTNVRILKNISGKERTFKILKEKTVKGWNCTIDHSMVDEDAMIGVGSWEGYKVVEDHGLDYQIKTFKENLKTPLKFEINK